MITNYKGNDLSAREVFGLVITSDYPPHVVSTLHGDRSLKARDVSVGSKHRLRVTATLCVLSDSVHRSENMSACLNLAMSSLACIQLAVATCDMRYATGVQE